MARKAIDIANFYVNLANGIENEEIDNLKLNKICFYAQAWHLVRFGRPLFEDEIEAWKYGPVIPAVYYAYKVCGRSPIEQPVSEVDENEFTSEELSLLIDVYMTYGKYTSRALIGKTHEKGSPWAVVYEEDRNNKITNDVIRKCFADSDELESMQLILTPETVVEYG